MPCTTMLEKALWYIEHEDTHFQKFEYDDWEGHYYLILKTTDTTGLKKITKKSLDMYWNVFLGKNTEDTDTLEYTRIRMHPRRTHVLCSQA